jgi:hypothetical protein
MRITGKQLRQIIREVLSEGPFDSAAYIAGRIEPTYRQETPKPDPTSVQIITTYIDRHLDRLKVKGVELKKTLLYDSYHEILKLQNKNPDYMNDPDQTEYLRDIASVIKIGRDEQTRDLEWTYSDMMEALKNHPVLNPELEDVDVPETSASFALRQGHHHREGLPAPKPEDFF